MAGKDREERGVLTHGGDANERRADTGIQALAQAIAGNALADDVDGRRVDARLGSLQADFDEVKGVADDDGADAAHAAGDEAAGLVDEAGGGGGLDLFLLVGRGELVLEALDDGLGRGGAGA